MLMHCFTKVSRVPIVCCSGRVHSEVIKPFSKTVEENGLPTTIVVFESVPSRIYSEKADIPESDNYKLSEMLKQGFVPNEVPVNNLLSSMDELDGVNQELIDRFNSAIELEKNNVVIE